MWIKNNERCVMCETQQQSEPIQVEFLLLWQSSNCQKSSACSLDRSGLPFLRLHVGSYASLPRPLALPLQWKRQHGKGDLTACHVGSAMGERDRSHQLRPRPPGSEHRGSLTVHVQHIKALYINEIIRRQLLFERVEADDCTKTKSWGWWNEKLIHNCWWVGRKIIEELCTYKIFCQKQGRLLVFSCATC